MLSIKNLDLKYQNGFSLVAEKLGIELGDNGLVVHVVLAPHLSVEKTSTHLNIQISSHNELYVALRVFKENEDKATFKIDYPKKIKNLTFMLDASRNAVATTDTVKDYLLNLVIFGYDALQLYTEDTFEMEGEPFFGYMRGAYTKVELQEIEEFAEELGMELVPCIQTLAHLNAITRYRQYGHLFDTLDILLVGEEKTYEFIEKMIQTVATTFKSKKINIGMDEAYMLGRGKYLDKNGYQNRFEIMVKHLRRVLDICKKYGLEPMMWLDMFFAQGWGDYYNKEKQIPQSTIDQVPKEVSLVYWDYYHTDVDHYEKMIEKHQAFNNPIYFAGGAWKWIGFTPDNRFSLAANKASMVACANKGVDNVIITSWGDNGAEASPFSILPSLAYNGVLKYGHQEIDDAFKHTFKVVTKVDFDAFMLIDSANQLTNNLAHKSTANKHFLYNDILLGLLDSTTEAHYPKIYTKHINKMKKQMDNYGEYRYIFETQFALLKVLKKKVLLGVELRRAYQRKDKDGLLKSLRDLKQTKKLIVEFKDAFMKQWYLENKAFGYEIQDLRIGGILQRIDTAILKLNQYLNGEITRIEELEVEVLDYYGNKDVVQKSHNIAEFRYKPVVSVGVTV